MDSLMRLCCRLFHWTSKGYWPFSLRTWRLGVRLVTVGVVQPTRREDTTRSGKSFFRIPIRGGALHKANPVVKLDFVHAQRVQMQPLSRLRFTIDRFCAGRVGCAAEFHGCLEIALCSRAFAVIRSGFGWLSSSSSSFRLSFIWTRATRGDTDAAVAAARAVSVRSTAAISPRKRLFRP